MHEVTQKEFYAVIGPLDVVLSVIGDEVEFRMRYDRRLVGKTVSYKLEDDKYFLT